MEDQTGKRIAGTTKDEIRAELPELLQPHYDQLVETYRFYALVHHGKPFVSYRVLAELVISGWRQNADAQHLPK